MIDIINYPSILKQKTDPCFAHVIQSISNPYLALYSSLDFSKLCVSPTITYQHYVQEAQPDTKFSTTNVIFSRLGINWNITLSTLNQVFSNNNLSR